MRHNKLMRSISIILVFVSIAIQRITAHIHMNETNQCNRIGE